METFAAAVACAEWATSWLQSQEALERDAPPGTDYARRCHLVRNRLGALQAALEVHAISAPGSADAQEAESVAVRQAASLAALIEELKETPWAVR